MKKILSSLFLLLSCLCAFTISNAQKQITKTGLMISFYGRTAFFECKDFSLYEFKDLKRTMGLETPSMEMFVDFAKTAKELKVIRREVDRNDKLLEDTVILKYVPIKITYAPYSSKYASDTCTFMFKWKKSEYDMNYLCNVEGYTIKDIKKYKSKIKK